MDFIVIIAGFCIGFAFLYISKITAKDKKDANVVEDQPSVVEETVSAAPVVEEQPEVKVAAEAAPKKRTRKPAAKPAAMKASTKPAANKPAKKTTKK